MAVSEKTVSPKSKSLVEILDLSTVIDIVDVGASPSGGSPPYKPLMDGGGATVIGFEPYFEALERLNAQKKEGEIYLPYSLGDGKLHEFKHCVAPEMSSLLEPNTKILSYFHGFPEFGKVKMREEVQTKRLDDIPEINNIDLLKIDIQGAELSVFEHGTQKLASCLVIHTEVEFIDMYVGQPLFSEVELFLRNIGFMFHRFAPLRSRVIQPMMVGESVTAGLSQVFDGDAIFIRDFTKLHQMKAEKLLKMAVILHDVYGSLDMVYRILTAHDKRKRSKYAAKYLKAV